MKFLKLSRFEYINIGIFTLLVFDITNFYVDDIHYATEQGSILAQ